MTLDHAHMLQKRGHLRARRHGYPIRVEYYVEDDRMIEVVGDPIRSSASTGDPK